MAKNVRQDFLNSVINKLQSWSYQPESIGHLTYADFFDGKRGRGGLTNRAVEYAVAAVVDGVKPGTQGEAWAKYHAQLTDAGWKRFVAAVRREVSQSAIEARYYSTHHLKGVSL